MTKFENRQSRRVVRKPKKELRVTKRVVKPWTEEDICILKALVQSKLNSESWNSIAKKLKSLVKILPARLRTGKECREKWEAIATKRKWYVEEFIQFTKIFRQVGPNWALISDMLNTKTKEEIEIRYNSALRKYERIEACCMHKLDKMNRQIDASLARYRNRDADAETQGSDNEA